MKITPISANSWQLTLLSLVNCYLVLEADGFTLIDTTLNWNSARIIAAAKSLGAPIRRIAVTHAHQDHVGSVDTLLGALGSISFAASARSLPLLRRPPDKSLRAGEALGKIKGRTPGIQSVPTILAADGKSLGSLRIIATPGHIPGHVAFFDERDGTLFAGDALIAVGRLSVCGWTPWYFPSTPFTWSNATALASARRLIAYPIERFACGHGPVREGGIPALQAAIDYATARMPI